MQPISNTWATKYACLLNITGLSAVLAQTWTISISLIYVKNNSQFYNAGWHVINYTDIISLNKSNKTFIFFQCPVIAFCWRMFCTPRLHTKLHKIWMVFTILCMEVCKISRYNMYTQSPGSCFITQVLGAVIHSRLNFDI